uniref:SCAPER_N domain-containing protein n=1 Tax=Elaeophora elaphi TaxID=1147741 RepID=A0A0R3RTF6_9BILA
MSANNSCLVPKSVNSDAVYDGPSSVPEKKLDVDRKKAKQWTYYIGTLNRTINCIYDICQKEQTVNGCKILTFSSAQEALMYLSNSVRDFESLIKIIQLEIAWDEKSSRRRAVAWEIRKAISPSGKTIVERPDKKDADSLINVLKLWVFDFLLWL